MTNIIVGTAGHIDHGKTSLVRALTGIDADRLAEEKRRGITIDLGFAHLQVGSDLRLGFVDVPGHERFVRNMLAGAGGIDIVLFVIAADESIKPQTREHFEICRLLGLQAGVVAITRADLVDPEILELVKLEAAEFVTGSFLEKAPQVAVSSVTGAGIPELLQALDQVARSVSAKPAQGWFRMPVDRAFTMRGFGAVVTGTVIGGEVRREAEVELYPTGRVLRVRGVQVHGEAADTARAGQRAAINLADIEQGDLARGMVLSAPGQLNAVTSFDGRLELLAGAKPLKNRAPVHLHTGSAAVEAEVRLLERAPSLAAGETAWVRFALREPVLVLPGDRFIIRSFSPVVTIGGGTVVDISGFRYRGGQGVASRLEALASGDPQRQTEVLLGDAEYGMDRAVLLARSGLRELPASEKVETTGTWMIGAAQASQLRQFLAGATAEFHKQNPLLPGIPRQELKGRVVPTAPQHVFDYLLDSAQNLTTEDGVVRLRSHSVGLRDDETRAREQIVNSFAIAGFAPPAAAEVLANSGIDAPRARTILMLLLREGTLVAVSKDMIFCADAVKRLRQVLAEHEGQRFGIAEFKDWTGISRKYSVPLLEYFDRERVTRRDGDARVVVSR